MQSIARSGARTAPRLQRVLRQPQRRQASHGELEPQQPAGPSSPNESFGRGFYIGILCIPAAIGLYTISRPSQDGQDPYLTSVIKKAYTDLKAQNSARNDLHTRMIEQAAEDRTLFLNDSGQYNTHIEHSFIESLNAGSPWNVPAGQGHINLDELIAKYQKEAYEMNELKLKQLRENKIPVEQPFVREMPKSTPAANDS